MAKAPELEIIMERVGDGAGPENFAMWACRGAGRGCKRNAMRSRKKHCDDCISARNDETLAQLMARMKRGDA